MSADPGGSWGVVTDPYIPPQQGPKFNLPRCGCVTVGAGVPDNTTGDGGDIYVDSNTENIYQKQGDTYVLVGVGGGGGGATQVFAGHYAQAAPPFTPTASVAIAIDLDPPEETWIWSGGAWA